MKVEPYIKKVTDEFDGHNEGLSVIIPVRGKHFKKQLTECLKHVQASLSKNYEIIIVEEDNTKNFSNFTGDNVKYLFMYSEKPFCKAKCFNFGVSRSNYSKICALDCDMIVPKGLLRFGEAVLTDYDAVFPAGDIYYTDDYPDGDIFKWNGRHWNEKEGKFSFHGGCVMINKAKYEELGGYSEMFVGYGSEDTEFVNRILDTCNVYNGNHFDLLHMYHDSDHKGTPDDWKTNEFIVKNLETFRIERRIIKARISNTFIDTMKTVKLVDSGTLGKATTFFNGGIDQLKSRTVQWDKISDPTIVGQDELVAFTESAIPKAKYCTSKNKVLILTEPRAINPRLNSREAIHELLKVFRFIFTHDEQIARISPRCVFYMHGGTWIHQDINFDKTKHCSFIASNKRQTDGHKLRHQINKMNSEFDRYGTITGNKLADKFDALGDYRFSIVVENCRQKGYFTEKLIDCFRTETIPIYWGAPNIDMFFDGMGMFKFNTVNELEKILEKINSLVYDDMYEHVKRNKYLSLRCIFFEDQFYSWLMDMEHKNKILK